jgi:hypothetical protein
MSCVDSAIIKALVEHIGMNPDSVVGSGGGIIPTTWTTVNIENKDYTAFTLPTGVEIKRGSCLVLKGKGEIAPYTRIEYYCTMLGEIDGMPTYEFSSYLVNPIQIVFRDGKYVIISNGFSDNFEIPDNNDYGFFGIETVADCARVIGVLVSRIVKSTQ